MGTWASLTLVTTDSAAVASLARETLSVFHDVDSLMSNWTNVSEVARINREAARGTISIHPEVADVVALALQVARESDGAFDITVEPLVRLWGFIGGKPHVPPQQEVNAALQLVGYQKVRFDAGAATIQFARDGVRIDLGGIAKGYSVDLAADRLRDAGVSDALVDLSGNMVALGDSPSHAGWTVGIRDPSGTLPYVARVGLRNEAVATAGNYEQFVEADGKRYGHILDPRTGYSVRGLSSVTVVAATAFAADAWDTAFFVLGSEAARRIAHERTDLAVVLIEPRENGEPIIWVEEQLRSRFQLVSEAEGSHTLRFF